MIESILFDYLQVKGFEGPYMPRLQEFGTAMVAARPTVRARILCLMTVRFMKVRRFVSIPGCRRQNADS